MMMRYTLTTFAFFVALSFGNSVAYSSVVRTESESTSKSSTTSSPPSCKKLKKKITKVDAWSETKSQLLAVTFNKGPCPFFPYFLRKPIVGLEKGPTTLTFEPTKQEWEQLKKLWKISEIYRNQVELRRLPSVQETDAPTTSPKPTQLPRALPTSSPPLLASTSPSKSPTKSPLDDKCRGEDTWCVSRNKCVWSVRSCPPPVNGDSCEKYKKPIEKWDTKFTNKTKLMMGLLEGVDEKKCKTTLSEKKQIKRLEGVIKLYKPEVDSKE
mmetsp:Transcript_41572/g.46377  ORF Transcript_41572/g.46377 Transcript_41572/m.46377 type:complete len:268 (-) Transcript_41572:115-918(-)